MNRQNQALKRRGVATLVAAVAVAVLGLGISSAGDNVERHHQSNEPIVGFWQVTYKDATTKNVILNVWEAWHSDRTEMQNVSANPIGGNVCQGAWVPLGHRTYGLNHPAYIFLTEPEGNEGQLNPEFSIDILARVTVDKDGSTLAGTGVIKAIAGTDPLDPTADVLSSQNLIITGKRVTVDVGQLPPA
ncbi:MAG TPA: hypothetical protein VJ728_03405 [Candidatus Binataceae bacterium]|nr:hypothetical protein [Candidatus Binataceae bacterium]